MKHSNPDSIEMPSSDKGQEAPNPSPSSWWWQQWSATTQSSEPRASSITDTSTTLSGFWPGFLGFHHRTQVSNSSLPRATMPIKNSAANSTRANWGPWDHEDQDWVMLDHEYGSSTDDEEESDDLFEQRNLSSVDHELHTSTHKDTDEGEGDEDEDAISPQMRLLQLKLALVERTIDRLEKEVNKDRDIPVHSFHDGSSEPPLLLVLSAHGTKSRRPAPSFTKQYPSFMSMMQRQSHPKKASRYHRGLQ